MLISVQLAVGNGFCKKKKQLKLINASERRKVSKAAF
jgi:hypothetical protein